MSYFEEELEFLSLCSTDDCALLTGKAEMNLQDFERITYLTMNLNFTLYTMKLQEQYIDFTMKLSEKMDRENEIHKEYPSYYEDEGVGEEQEKWVKNFLSQLPKNKYKHYVEVMKTNINYY